MVEQQADRTRLTLPIIDWGQVPLGIAYAIAYGLLFTLAGYIVGLVEFSLWFPAAGLRFAILLIAGWQFAFIAALAEILTQGFLGEWSNWGTDYVWQMIAGVAGPPLIYGAVIWFVTRVLRVHIDSVRFANIGWLCTAALLAPALTAPVSTGFLYLADRLPGESFWPATLSFWIGDAVGVLMLAPPLLLAWQLCKFRRDQPSLSLVDRLRAFPRRGIKPKEQGFIEVAVSIVLIAALYWFVTSPQEQPYWYLAFLPLVWLALRFGLFGAVVAVFGLNLLAGWIASQLDDPSQRIDLQLFLIALSLTGLFLGAIVSERVRSEARHSKAIAQLAQADRQNSLGALSAAIVHEIGQPVTTLESYAKEAARRIETGELTSSDLDRSVGHLVGEAERLRQIVESVQRLGRKDRLRRELVDINDAVGNVLTMLKIEARDSGARLEVSLTPDRLTTMGDPIQLEQVVLNLGRNGIQAMAGATGNDDQVLKIWTYAEGDRIGIGIQDNGPGFEANELEEVFEPFTSSKLDGLGLGLAISKAIVTQHDGELRVESKPGSGATFTIILPRETSA